MGVDDEIMMPMTNLLLDNKTRTDKDSRANSESDSDTRLWSRCGSVIALNQKLVRY